MQDDVVLGWLEVKKGEIETEDALEAKSEAPELFCVLGYRRERR